MKIKWCLVGFLAFVFCVGAQLHAQQTGVATESFEAAKAKAEKGDAKAQAWLGDYYYQKLFPKKGLVAEAQDLAEAEKSEKWFRKAAEQGNAEGQYGLGCCYEYGLVVNKDYIEAVKWYSKAAEQNNSSGQCMLGACYEEGNGVAQDYIEAVKWYRKAAEQNLRGGQYRLALMYAAGNGVEKNLTESAKWFCRNADQGDDIDQFELGLRFDNGDGVEKSSTEAAKWYHKAANQGNARAENNLGNSYYEGRGVPQDYAEGVKWYRKAADQNFADAQFNLGVIYDNGEGVEQNYAEAVKWYRKAAEQGCTTAQLNLGVMYYKGNALPQDYVEAYKWFNLSASHGNTSAMLNRDRIVHFMTPDQIAEGQRRAVAFVPRKETPDSSSANSTSLANPSFVGTGFFITDDGYLISNYHVVKDATKVRLVTSAGTIDAKVVQVDAANDLALLKADGRFAPLPILPSRSAHLGGTVATIGFPDPSLQGFSPKLAKGEIASLSGAGDDPRYFQISVPVQPGNSGGALVDERGNVIGIVSAKLDASVALAATGSLPENVNYAVKSSLLLSFLESVPDVDAKLKAPVTADEKFEDVVKSAQDAAVLVLVY